MMLARVMLLKFGTKPSEILEIPIREKYLMLKIFAEEGDRRNEAMKSI